MAMKRAGPAKPKSGTHFEQIPLSAVKVAEARVSRKPKIRLATRRPAASR
jgi:hypothetical protein